jgi:hypothetical protein
LSRAWILLSVGIFGLATFIPAFWLDTDRFAAYATAAQAFGVFIALVLGILTLQSQNGATQSDLQKKVHIDRVSRTLEFHKSFTHGEITAARSHLLHHLRAVRREEKWARAASPHTHSGPVRRTTLSELRNDYRLSTYLELTECSCLRNPIDDACSVLWYFERTEAALSRGLLEDDLLHKLLGRHIVWWDEVIRRDSSESMRPALARLGDWAWAYSEEHPETMAYVRTWQATFAWGFPESRFANQPPDQGPTA